MSSSNMLRIEASSALRTELVNMPEGRLYMAILTQVLNDVFHSRSGFHIQRAALEWLLRKDNPMRDFALLLAEIDETYIIKKVKAKVGHQGYHELTKLIYGH